MSVPVNGISIWGNSLISDPSKPKELPRTNTQLFDDMLTAAKGIYSEANANINSFEDMQMRIASGESDDFVGLTLMQSKANSSMQFIVQSTNKVVEAYREVMRMQV